MAAWLAQAVQTYRCEGIKSVLQLLGNFASSARRQPEHLIGATIVSNDIPRRVRGTVTPHLGEISSQQHYGLTACFRKSLARRLETP
jgi:hypothetical protein